MRRTQTLAAVASASLGLSSLAFQPPVFRFPNTIGPGRRSYSRNMVGVPAGINRHTGKPHENLREKARRVRQMARDVRTALNTPEGDE